MHQPSRTDTPAAFQLSRLLQENLVIFGCLGLFLLYGSFRQRYIWGVDSFGYYELGKLFSEGRLFLPVDSPGGVLQPLVPWGFMVNASGHAVPDYPPGFSILLAIGHLLRAPLWVTPACGVLSCWLLLRLLRTRVQEGTALCFTAAWAVMPLTVYGSTMLMSDLVAATALLGGLLAHRQGRFALAAWIFGFSFTVRPTNVLFFAPFLLALPPDRATLRFLLHLTGPCALYGIYNYLIYGAPWRTGYGNVLGLMSVEVVPRFFSFFAVTTWQLLGPVLLAFAAIALRRPTRERLFLLFWPLAFMVFYSFWEAGGTDRWWWARFILPGYAGLFLLAAEGCEAGRAWVGERWPAARWARAAVLALVAVLPVQYLRFGLTHEEIWTRTTGVPNIRLVEQVQTLVPAGSLIGTLEHASSFYLYGRLTPFVSVQREAPELVAEALRKGRRVFVLPEPWHTDDPVILELFRRFDRHEVARVDTPWLGQILYELKPR